MNFKRHVIPFATWLALSLGILYLMLFFVLGGRENFAVATSMLALSLSVKTYGALLADKQRSNHQSD